MYEVFDVTLTVLFHTFKVQSKSKASTSKNPLLRQSNQENMYQIFHEIIAQLVGQYEVFPLYTNPGIILGISFKYTHLHSYSCSMYVWTDNVLLSTCPYYTLYFSPQEITFLLDSRTSRSLQIDIGRNIGKLWSWKFPNFVLILPCIDIYIHLAKFC